MKVLVAIKRVIDPYVKIHIKSDQTAVETNNVKMAMNPFDEIAVEEAIRWKEQGIASEVVAVTAGNASCQETLRTALALGADRGIHIESDETLEPISVAQLLKAVADKEDPSIVILGKQAIDDDCNQVGQMLAALLGWPQGTFASKTEFSEDNKIIAVTREVDGGLESLKLSLPAIITTDLRLNEPRYPSLPNIMKAKRKPIDNITPEALSVTISTHLEVQSVKPPEPRKAGIKVESVDELVEKLKNDEKVI